MTLYIFSQEDSPIYLSHINAATLCTTEQEIDSQLPSGFLLITLTRSTRIILRDTWLLQRQEDHDIKGMFFATQKSRYIDNEGWYNSHFALEIHPKQCHLQIDGPNIFACELKMQIATSNN
jgi:hypothetical protein